MIPKEPGERTLARFVREPRALLNCAPAGREVSKATSIPRDYFIGAGAAGGGVVPPLPLHDPLVQLLWLLQPAARMRPAATLATDTAASTLRILFFFIESSMMANVP
jgi:hypothetical protein